MKRLPHHIKNVLQSSVVILSLQSVATGLEIGDEVSVEALGKAHFIQGAAPENWEEGKLYVLVSSSVTKKSFASPFGSDDGGTSTLPA